MLTKGTKNKSAIQLAQQMDGIGATLTSNTSPDFYTIYAEGLKKHTNIILENMSDILLNPNFPADEFIKLQQQTIAGLQYEKSNSGSLAQALSKIAVYGKDHPYSSRKTESSINSITTNDLIEFHTKWAKPGNASLAVVGDVKPDEIVKELEKYFKIWKKGDFEKINIPPANPLPKGIYFVKRPSSVQTSLVLSSIAMPYNDRDFDNMNMASKLIGGNNGRLYQTLREKYSFTYSPYAFLTSTKYTNRFGAVAEVAAEKTDSSIAVILGQLRDIINNSPSKEELDRVRTSYIGNYNMSFENSLFIASIIQNEEFYGKKVNELKNYTKKLTSITPSDITSAVSTYANPDNMQIIVAGDPSIIPTIEKYGKVFLYDLDLNPLTGADAKLEKISMSVDELISKYEVAIGGKSSLDTISTINVISSAELNLNGQAFPGRVLTQKKIGNKIYNYSDFGIFESHVWTDGQSAWSGQSNETATAQEGNAKDQMLFEASLFPVLALKSFNHKLEVLGKQGNQILLQAVNKTGSESVYYFNSENFLLEKTELNILGPNGVTEIWEIISDEYSDFNGIKLPMLQKTISPAFSITLKSNYEVNKIIEDSVFRPQAE
jgi:predicted Zn-dependent peptidase